MKRAPWPAPRTAYLMTAMTAENDDVAASELWFGLACHEQRDVLRSLAAQCRASISGAQRDVTGPVLAALRQQEPGPTEALEHILQDTEWPIPACPSCQVSLAAMLMNLSIRASRTAGLSLELIAHHCREAAAL